MEYRHLGRLGVLVSPLCLGTMNFPTHASEEEAHAVFDRALEHGINFFDTANRYGGDPSKGLTEQILGRWFAKGEGRRDKVVLTTKVYGQTSEWPNHSKLSALNIRRACEASLRRLQTDHIDLYQMHHVDRDTPWDEIWQAMEQLVREGKVVYVGSSNFAGWHIARANETARDRHLLGLASEQCLYNLTERTVELEVLPACQAYGMGVLPWSPLAGGMLGGALHKADGGRRARPDVQRRIERHRRQLEGYEKLAADLGEEPATVALAWLLANPVVTAPIIGPRSVAQLDSAVRATRVKLDGDAMKRLDQMFRGPGGPAPEAFAW